MIQFKDAWLSLTAIAGIVLFTGVAAQAETGVTIERIEEVALDNLIRDGHRRLLVSFMAAWCGPCVDELPALNNLYQKYKNQGIELIGISIDLGGPSAMQPIVSKLKINFPVYWKLIFSLLMLMFIRQGKIVERLPGKRTERFLDQKIRELLK